MGSQVTTRPVESYESQTGTLICLDLNAEGRLLWKIAPDDEKWAFEGAPLVDGTDVYVAMRKSDVRPQAHVACFDGETGRRRWRTMISSAETPAGGNAEELTHNLLTLEQGVLYANTNLGAVAAISARDGHVLWISTYPRAKRSSSSGQDKRAAHFYRDLNPCVYHRGTLAVAPSDSEYILAFDAASGQMLWETHLAVGCRPFAGRRSRKPDRQRRSAVVDRHRKRQSGRQVARAVALTATGEGFWPATRFTGRHASRCMCLNQKVSQPGLAPLLRDPILLAGDQRQAGGGNLVIGQGLMLIATANKLFAFGHPSSPAASAGSAEKALKGR